MNFSEPFRSNNNANVGPGLMSTLGELFLIVAAIVAIGHGLRFLGFF